MIVADYRIVRRQREVINCCLYLNLESELQPAWFCSPSLLKACFYNIFLTFEARQPRKVIVQHAYFYSMELLCWKPLKQVGLCETGELIRPRRAATVDLFGPAARRRRWPKLTGAPPPTQWRRCRALHLLQLPHPWAYISRFSISGAHAHWVGSLDTPSHATKE